MDITTIDAPPWTSVWPKSGLIERESGLGVPVPSGMSSLADTIPQLSPVAIWHSSIAAAYWRASLELLGRPVSQVATALSTLPSQSSSTALPFTSNAPGLTSDGSPQPSFTVSQQSPPQVV